MKTLKWSLVITILIIVFLVSLLVSKYREVKLLETSNKMLVSRIEDYSADSANIIIEKEILYREVVDLTRIVNSRTTLVKELVNKITELKYRPIIIRAIPCDELEPYSGSDTSSRGF